MIRRLSLSSETGLAVPVVMATMLVLSLLSTALLSTALRSSSSAVGDTNSKRALGAAEAGLQTAGLRLRNLNPAGNMCMTTPTPLNPTGAVAPTPNTTNGQCPASTPEPVSGGATFTYWITPRGASCAALPGVSTTAFDRCITSVGEANGVKRRIQTRVESGPNYPFARAGIMGIDRVTLRNGVTVEDTDVGSNGPITLTGSPSSVRVTEGNGVEGEVRPYVPGGSVIRSGSTTIEGGIVNQSQPFGLQHPDGFPTSLTTNNNAALPAALVAQGIPGTAYNETTRVLSIPTNKLFIVPAGTYNFCGFNMASGSEMNTPNSYAKATIYLDSPLRDGSNCTGAGATGKAVMTNAEMNYGISDRNIWFWVYGTVTPPGELPVNTSSDIQVLSGAHIDAVWYAPYSRFYGASNITVHGAVAAREVFIENSAIVGFDVAVEQETGPGAGPVQRRAWVECRAVATVATDPESGC